MIVQRPSVFDKLLGLLQQCYGVLRIKRLLRRQGIKPHTFQRRVCRLLIQLEQCPVHLPTRAKSLFAL